MEIKGYLVSFMESLVCLHAGSAAVVAAVKSWPCYHGCNGSIKASQNTAFLSKENIFVLGLLKTVHVFNPYVSYTCGAWSA